MNIQQKRGNMFSILNIRRVVGNSVWASVRVSYDVRRLGRLSLHVPVGEA